MPVYNGFSVRHSECGELLQAPVGLRRNGPRPQRRHFLSPMPPARHALGPSSRSPSNSRPMGKSGKAQVRVHICPSKDFSLGVADLPPLLTGWVATIVVVFVAHELLHGLVVRGYGARPRFGVGLAARVLPALYTTAPGARFSRSQ